MNKFELARKIANQARVGVFQLLDDFGVEIEDLAEADNEDYFDGAVADLEDYLDKEIKRLIAIKRTVISLQYKEVHG